MAITIEQIISIGFKPAKRKSPFAKKYDTLIYPLNKTDYLYLGYNTITKKVDFKKIWKSVLVDGERMSYELTHIRDASFSNLKEYIESCND